MALGLFLTLLAVPTAFAETLQSANYKFDETSVGTGGLINSESANFKVTEATGDVGVGNSASTNFQINAGSKTNPDPVLAFSVNTSTANFGTFSATTPTTATASFSVLNYTSYGYIVQVFGNTPTNSGHALTPMNISGPSQIGTEQFGINLVANTAPVSFGANPDNGQFGYGSINANYATSNIFRYVDGETIASSPKSSGVTNYTISYLINVAGLTPGGQYTANQSIVVTGTF